MNKKNICLLTLLLAPGMLLPSVDITAYLKKKLKQSPVGLMRYESPEALKQIIALPFDQIMIDNNAPIDGAKVIITYDKADDYDVASRSFTTLNAGVVNEIMDNEKTRDKIDKKARKKRRATRLALKEEQMITGFKSGIAGKKIEPVIKDQFDEKIKALKNDETTRILERSRSKLLRELHETESEEIEDIKEQRREKKIKRPEVKKQIEAVRKKYREKTKEIEERKLALTGAQQKELAATIAIPMEKLNGERQAFVDGYAAGTKAVAQGEAEQDAILTGLRKVYQDKIQKIAIEDIVLKEKDRTPRDMPMSIELTGVLRLIKAELIPGKGEPVNTKWEMPDFLSDMDKGEGEVADKVAKEKATEKKMAQESPTPSVTHATSGVQNNEKLKTLDAGQASMTEEKEAPSPKQEAAPMAAAAAA